MVYKSVLAMILLLCITEAIQAGCTIRLGPWGSRSLSSSGWFGRKRDFYYVVPSNVDRVRLTTHKECCGGCCDAGMSWTPGSRHAKVHVWVNGAWRGRNRIFWTAWGCT